MDHLAVPTFARRMREERARAGLSQAGLAERLSERLGYRIDGSSVTRIEKQKRGVRLVEAMAIAEELGVGVADLLRERDAVDDEIAELQRELDTAKWRAEKAKAAFQDAQDEVEAIRRRIAELEKTRRG